METECARLKKTKVAQPASQPACFTVWSMMAADELAPSFAPPNQTGNFYSVTPQSAEDYEPPALTVELHPRK
jgi:hypothetical protein